MEKMLYEQLVAYILENQNRFYRLAYSYTKNQEDALDAVQNAVCKALEAFESIRNPRAIKTWFYRILIHESLQILQKQKKEAASSDWTDVDMVYHEKAYNPESVDEELDQLEPDVQQIIRLRFFEEMSLKEISGITGYNVNTVKTKLYRGLKQLRQTMQEASL